MTMEPLSLTPFSHGGGCGCKIAPGVLAEILKRTAAPGVAGGDTAGKLPLDVIRRILQGGKSVCAEAGIPLAGGHPIDSVEPIYDLVAFGLVHPKRIKRNASARRRGARASTRLASSGRCRQERLAWRWPPEGPAGVTCRYSS